MQTGCLRAQSWTVGGPGGTPVPQRGLGSLPVSQPVCDGEAAVSLQLRQNHQHLPERRNTAIIIPLSAPNLPQNTFISPKAHLYPSKLLYLPQNTFISPKTPLSTQKTHLSPPKHIYLPQNSFISPQTTINHGRFSAERPTCAGGGRCPRPSGCRASTPR